MNKSLTIGKSPSCDIVIANDYVSRHHATLSIVGNQYVYQDLSKNGSTIGGRVIINEKVTVAPGTEILLANRVPLPWAQIYPLLPIGPIYVGGGVTRVDNPQRVVGQSNQASASNQQSAERPDAWIYIVGFLIPLIGWILYFVWRDEHYEKAHAASVSAWIGFGINLFFTFIGIAAS